MGLKSGGVRTLGGNRRQCIQSLHNVTSKLPGNLRDHDHNYFQQDTTRYYSEMQQNTGQ